jgi:hypothetical protein
MPTGPDLEHPPTLTQRAVPSERFPLGRRSAPISVFPPQRLDLLLRDVGAVVATAPRISNVLVAPMPRPTLAGPPGPRPTGLNHGRYRRGGRGARGSPKRRRPLPVRFRGACREVARRVRGAQIPAAIVGMVKMPPRPRQDRLGFDARGGARRPPRDGPSAAAGICVPSPSRTADPVVWLVAAVAAASSWRWSSACPAHVVVGLVARRP